MKVNSLQMENLNIKDIDKMLLESEYVSNNEISTTLVATADGINDVYFLSKNNKELKLRQPIFLDSNSNLFQKRL